jgi:hypothetical protein
MVIMNRIRSDRLRDEIINAKEGGKIDVRLKILHLYHSAEECLSHYRIVIQ